MALTAEQQSNVEIQIAVDNARHNNMLALEEQRSKNDAENESKRRKLESVRMAKDVLLENSRSKPVDSREVTVEDIISFAQTIENYVKS
jgi:hypothetical protein